jgi:hypothetical protein
MRDGHQIRPSPKLIVFISRYFTTDLFVALDTVLRFLHVKGLFTIVTLAAKSPFGDLAHIHFIGALGHLKNLIVATGAFQTLALHMDLMTEYDLHRPLRPECQIAASDHLGSRVNGQYHAEQKAYREYLLHPPTPL